MDDLQCCGLLNSISIISRRWVGDNGRLFAMKPFAVDKISASGGGLNPGQLDHE